eukprot:CAMPEP_0195527530 /NCGR_PEP_ID=MMETSP0794_2-20130614/29251_1 /TAXON_ID=515487 /ORGANISM="Stephanopyxis turris, Strain CCMP 815" /LENGTH=246 /DNA_ID=CAMNT_0040658453 /DNA_START=217 /DNA_END=957 /DNA_ORIENTATION=+
MELIKVMSEDEMRILHLAMDVDFDKLVSFEEGLKFAREVSISPMLRQSMAIMRNMDSNRDMFLSLEEFKSDLKHLSINEDDKHDLANRFASFDEDGDGVLSVEEVLPLLNFMFPFQRLDTNKDGVLSMTEFKQIAAPKLENAPPQEVEQSHAEGKIIFSGLDTNGDGKLCAKEHFTYESGIYAAQAAWKMLFEMADTNKDEQISMDELIAVRENPKFGGSAAFNFSMDWIKKVEEAVKQANAGSEL